MPEATIAILAGLLPHGHKDLLNGAECFVFRDAGVRHAAHALLEDLGVILLCEVAIVGEVLVAVMRYQAKE